jgi:hypothetical protein
MGHSERGSVRADFSSPQVARLAIERLSLLAMAHQAGEHINSAAQIAPMGNPIMALGTAVSIGTCRVGKEDGRSGNLRQRTVTSLGGAHRIRNAREGALLRIGDAHVHTCNCRPSETKTLDGSGTGMAIQTVQLPVVAFSDLLDNGCVA